MPRRPLLAAAATLSTLTLLTACNGSPEAGRPNTTPTTPTPTPTAPSTPTWTAEEQTAITAAKARYIAARTAVGNAFKQPAKANVSVLALAGNGGTWATTVAAQLDFQVKNGWYQTGDATITGLAVRSVNLKLAQPEVRLTSCIDSSQVVDRYQANGKPVPIEGDNGSRHRFESRLIYGKSARTGRNMWFLVDEKTTKTC
ncbi:hypothetical protein [Kribbella speibonae]|uniref:Lipoprotein n=1 Tax=Kribbella speibonae TaxID=1572660 RepID=A0A4R0IZ11_9ACTN|nr:hypothetical protein [Kribbella speibonae]TCC38547.1 hypothetical protein E0H92_19205 [Kribbella speibonae]